MKKGKAYDNQNGKEELVEIHNEEEGEGEEGGIHEFEDESGGLFCALYIPDANRYGHGPHPTVISVYGGDSLITFHFSNSCPMLCYSIPSRVILSYLILSYPILSFFPFLTLF